MKRLKNYFLMLLMMLGVVTTATSCKDDDPIQGGNTPAEEGKDVTYTVMMYGCGGGNLDDALLYNLGGVEAAAYSKKVNFTALIKFSKPYQAQYPGTRLINKTENGMTNEQKYGSLFRLDDPQNLANFITDAKTRMPADKYILILWNHGSSFTISDQPVADSYPETDNAGSRGLAYDDNIGGKGISIFEMQKALDLAGCTGENKLDLLYWDVCLMNTIENLYQVRNNTKYVLGAAHYTSGLGGQYTALLESLNDNNTIEDAMKEYMPATFSNWTEVEGESGGKDLVLSDMNYVESVAQAVKEYTSTLVKLKKGFDNDPSEVPSAESLKFDLINSACQPNDFGYYYELEGSESFSVEERAYMKGSLYYFGNTDAVDMLSIFTRIGGSTLNASLSASALKLKRAIQSMCPIRYSAETPDFIEDNKVSVGICWSRNTDFASMNQILPDASNSLGKVYKMLDFDKLTGWSNYLSINDFKTLGVDANGQLYDTKFFTYLWSVDLIGSTDGGEESIEHFGSKEFTLTQACKYTKEFPNPNDQNAALTLGVMKSKAASLGWTQFKVRIKLDESEEVLGNDPFKDKYPTEFITSQISVEKGENE